VPPVQPGGSALPGWTSSQTLDGHFLQTGHIVLNARTTHAAVIDSFGGPDRFHLEELPLAAPGAGEVQIRVAAAAVNPVDLATRAGMVVPADAAHFPMTIGWDAAGTIERVGEDVADWQVGDRVAAMTPQPADQNGTYAEHMNVAVNLLARVPDGVSLEQAATIPLVGLTASQMVGWVHVPSGATLLVDAPLGAVGRLVVQLARNEGITVVAVTRPQDRDAALELGATEVVDRGDFTAAVRELYPRGVDAAIDLVGGATARASFASIRDGGAYITAVPPFLDNTGPFTSERDIRVEIQNAHPDAPVLTRLLEAVGRGELTSSIEHTYPLAEAVEAHSRQARGGLRGKLVLVP